MNSSSRYAIACAALLTAGLSTGALADENNANISGVIAGTYQNATESQYDGNPVHGELNGELYLYGTLDMGPGTWNVEARGSTTPRTNGVSSSYGSNGLVGETMDEDGDGRIAITQFFYELPVASGQFRLGLLDPAAVLDTNDVTNDEYTQFLAGAFINNPTIGFPSFVLGAAFQGDVTQHIDYKLFVGSDSGLEDEDHSYHNVFDVTGNRGRHDKGAFTAAELGWQASGYALKGGVWYDTGNVDDISNSNADASPYGVYVAASAPVGAGLVQARAGVANDDASEAANFLSVAYQLPIQMGQRDTTLGVALARTGASDDLSGSADAIYQAEAYWRINVVGPLYVSPDIQYIRNAGFDGNADDVWIAGARVGVVF